MKQGLVIRSTGSWYDIRDTDGHVWQARLKGKFKVKGLMTSNPLAVGDRVQFEIENTTENSATICAIDPRDNYLARQSVHHPKHAHLLAANLDQAILIATLDVPRTSLGFIDRFLVSAEAFRIPATLVFNKLDLFDAEGRAAHEALASMYASLGYGTLFTSTTSGEGLEDFRTLLTDKISLISGHSGVGKSTLVNYISPGLMLRTNEVSAFANKGVHTTTFAEMFEFQPNSFIIDTPGIKELGLANMETWEIAHYFPEMRDRLGQCRFHDCRHLNEPGCAIQLAVSDGTIAESRYNSYLSMASGEDNRK